MNQNSYGTIQNQKLSLFSPLVAFCLKIVQIESHSDMRRIFIPNLVREIMTQINVLGIDSFLPETILPMLVLCRKILPIIVPVDLPDKEVNTEIILDQDEINYLKTLQSVFTTCFLFSRNLLQWYCTDRDPNKMAIVNTLSFFSRDLIGIILETLSKYYAKVEHMIDYKQFTDAIDQWFNSAVALIDPISWMSQSEDNFDFDLRISLLDQLIHIYVCHKVTESSPRFEKDKESKIVLIFSNHSSIDTMSSMVRQSTRVLWNKINDMSDLKRLQSVVLVLLRIHCRNITEPSSELEDVIIEDLSSRTDSDTKSSKAIIKFHNFWSICRNLALDEVFEGIPIKPMNRVIMVLLNFATDEKIMNDKVELRQLSGSWIMDCARHNDLHKILQILAMMLLNPTTARISLQSVMILARITKSEISSMPVEANCVALSTFNQRQIFYHVCSDIEINALPIFTSSNSNANSCRIECLLDKQWVMDLSAHILSLPINSELEGVKTLPKKCGKNSSSEKIADNACLANNVMTHMVSDIPQFDDADDCDSVSSLSINSPFEQEIYDVMQYILDRICNENETMDNNAYSVTAKEAQEFHDIAISSSNNKLNKNTDKTDADTSLKNDFDQASVLGSLNAYASYSQSVPTRKDTVKRLRSGHRRQDSLQESIFIAGTKELNSFDLPLNTCPGDFKQPLLDATFSHMLLYTESPSLVDLARSEKLLRIFHSLLKHNNMIREAIISALIFTKSAQTDGSGHEIAKTVLKSFSSTAIISQELVDLFGRHQKSIQGDGFWPISSSKIESDAESNLLHRKYSVHSNSPHSPMHSQPQNDKNKVQTLFELLSTIITYYLRSYYLNSPVQNVNAGYLKIFWKCKIAALDCYAEILRALIDLLYDLNSQDLVFHVQHLYRKFNPQRVVVSLLLTAFPIRREQKDWKMPLAADIADFNTGFYSNNLLKDLIKAYHQSLLNFASNIAILEYNLNVGVTRIGVLDPIHIRSLFIKEHKCTFVELKMFVVVILNSLRQCVDNCNIWLQFIVGCLPYLDRALTTIAIQSVEQISRNIYQSISFDGEAELLNEVAMIEENPKMNDSSGTSNKHSVANPIDDIATFKFIDYRFTSTTENFCYEKQYPPNYILALLDTLRSILHFCLVEYDTSVKHGFRPCYLQAPVESSPLNATQQSSGSLTNTASNMIGSAIMSIPGTGILNNLFGRLTSTDTHATVTRLSEPYSAEWLNSQHELIKIFPSVLAILTDLWRFLKNNESDFKASFSMTKCIIKALQQKVIQILDPISEKHQNMLLNSFGIVWITRGNVMSNCNMNNSLESHSQLFDYTSRQNCIVELLLNIRAFSLSTIILTVNELLKDAKNKGSNDKLNISLLELLHQSTRQVELEDLKSAWGALYIFFSEITLTQLPARATFILFMTLVEFVRCCEKDTIMNDKSISKAILEVSQKLIEAMNAIVGWQLESVNWLKRTLVVRQDISPSHRASDFFEQRGATTASTDSTSIRSSTVSFASGFNRYSSLDGGGVASSGSTLQPSSTTSETKKSVSNLRASIKDNSYKRDPSSSTQALFLLAENLAELIDSTSKSDDKEKFLPVLQAVWNNTLPYLKEKGTKNVRCFLAGSQLLASISSYNYMRSIWKKNAFELIWDSAFFKMDIRALRYWLVTTDNLMTNDKTSFKEMLTRITASTSTALSNLITSREAEYEMRAQHMKRLSFVILSSELGQYNEQLSEILERLNENLRITQVPVIHTQVFNCYRILLIRMTPNSFETIWPPLYTELVQVLNQLVQQIVSSMAPGSAGNFEESRTAKEDQWMQLYLSACKLLETLCILPPGHVVQFQLCRWVFIPTYDESKQNELFVPFSVRIRKLLEAKYDAAGMGKSQHKSASLFNIKTLTSFQEFLPFFQTLSEQNNHGYSCVDINGLNDSSQSFKSLKNDRFRDEEYFGGTLSLRSAISRIENSLYVDLADHWQL